VLEENAEVFHAWCGRFKNPFAPKTPRVLPPETIFAKRISGADPDQFVVPLGPDFGHVSVTSTVRHGSSHHRSTHDETSINHERQHWVGAWGRNEMTSSECKQQRSQRLKLRLLHSSFAKTTVQKIFLLFGHHGAWHRKFQIQSRLLPRIERAIPSSKMFF
jgi:hypothetical protein